MKIRKGECKKCGKCCRYFLMGVRKEEDIDREYAKVRGIKVINDGKGNCSLLAEFPCLCYEDNPMPHCTIYPARPPSCRAYPQKEEDLIPGCGYYFEEEEDGN